MARHSVVLPILSLLSLLAAAEARLSSDGIVRFSGPARKAGWPSSYKIANARHANAAWQTYRGDSFEIYSQPVHLGYAEVYYSFQEPIPLPKDVVDRYAGKQMGITGYEVNVVRFDDKGNEESVPSYDAYNHHYVFFMKGSNWTEACVGPWCPPKDVKLPHADAPVMRDLRARMNGALGDNPLDIQILSEGNGNEHRGSFHGGPVNYAQVINSPDRLHPFVHLINTRGGGGRGGIGSTLLPKSVNSKPGGRYSGLIECPCTTRRVFNYTANTIDGQPPEITFDAPLGCRQELVAQNNTSCRLNTYKGGLRCCKHGMVLLDKDQPDPPGVDEFFYKIRIWHEEVTPKHKNMFRVFWMTDDRNNEYDIPPCSDESGPCVHTLMNRFTAGEMCNIWSCGATPIPEEGMGLVYAGPHIHVGGLSMELINADTGEQICYSEADYGKGEEARDEEGYVYAIPPCLWSPDDPSLPSPPRLHNNTRLITIAKYNSNPGRYGAMAFWQMRGAHVFSP